MVNEELYRCIAKVLQQSVNEQNLHEWLVTLSDNELLDKDQRRKARHQAKSIKLEEVLMNCCEIINNKERKLELLAEAFKDEDCPVKGISTDIILKLFQIGKVGESLIWMMDNWETLRASESLKEEASQVCPGISQDDWPLDFIYHLLTTSNSYALEKFVEDVKKKFQSTENESESSAYPAKMDVEHSTDDMQPSGFETTSFRQTSLFTDLDSDGNDGKDEAREHYPPSQSPEKSRDFEMYTQSPIRRTTDDILKDVTSFDVCSSAGEKSLMDWEVVSATSLARDEENDKKQKNPDDHPEREMETEQLLSSVDLQENDNKPPDIEHVKTPITRSQYHSMGLKLESKRFMSGSALKPGEFRSLGVGEVAHHIMKPQQPLSLPQGNTADVEMKEISDSWKTGEDDEIVDAGKESLPHLTPTEDGRTAEYSTMLVETKPKRQDTSNNPELKHEFESNQEPSPYNLQQQSLETKVQLLTTQDCGGKPNEDTIQSIPPSHPLRSIPGQADQAETSETHEDSSKSITENFAVVSSTSMERDEENDKKQRNPDDHPEREMETEKLLSSEDLRENDNKPPDIEHVETPIPRSQYHSMGLKLESKRFMSGGALKPGEFRSLGVVEVVHHMMKPQQPLSLPQGNTADVEVKEISDSWKTGEVDENVDAGKGSLPHLTPTEDGRTAEYSTMPVETEPKRQHTSNNCGGKPNEDTIQSIPPSYLVRSVPGQADQAETSQTHEDSSKSITENFADTKIVQGHQTRKLKTGLDNTKTERKTYASMLLVNSSHQKSTMKATTASMSEHVDPLTGLVGPIDVQKTEVEHDASLLHQRTQSTIQKDMKEASTISQFLSKSDPLQEIVSEENTEGITVHKLSRSSSETSTESCEETTSLAFFSSCYGKIEDYKFNLLVITKLAFPKETTILHDWPDELIQFLSNYPDSDKEFLETFLSICNIVMEKTKPMKKEYARVADKVGVRLIGSRIQQIKAMSDIAVILYHLVWPKESVEENNVHKKLLAKTHKKEKGHLERFCDALGMIFDNKRANLPTVQIEEKAACSNYSENIESGKGSSAGSIFEKKSVKNIVKNKLGLAKKGEKSDVSKKESTGSKNTKTTSKEQGGTVNQKNSSKTGGSRDEKRTLVRQKIKPIKQENSKTVLQKGSSETGKSTPGSNIGEESTKHVVRGSAEKTVQDHAINVDDEYHDALENFEDSVANIKMTESDDSFELRAAVTYFNPDLTTVFVAENCWNNWHPIKMHYNRKRKYYFVFLPLPPDPREFKYKYSVHVQGYDRYWEFIPSSGSDIVNRLVWLKKDVKCFHDVPVFALLQGQTPHDLITRDFYVHFPTTNILSEQTEKQPPTSLRSEISSCVKQMKSGWRTTDIGYKLDALNSQEIEIILLKWLAVCDGGFGETMDQLTLLLSTINLMSVLHEVNHKMFEAKFLSVLSQHLSVHRFNEIHQKRLYQLIKRELAEDGNRSSSVICEALITIYRQLKVLGNSPYVEWILTLPLYWLVENEGEVKKKPTTPKKGRSDLYMKSSLPEANKLSWSEIRKNCENHTSQKALVSLADTIHQIHEVHPWITGTYMYFLTVDSLLKMTRENSMYQITKFFDLDIVLNIILRDWRPTAPKSLALADALSVKPFFDQRFEAVMKSDPKSLSEEVKMTQKSSANNIMMSILKITNDFLKTDVYCGEKNKHTTFITNIAHASAEWTYHLQNDDETYDETRAQVAAILCMLVDKISKIFLMGQDDIQFINSLITLKWSDAALQNMWMQHIKAEASKSIQKKWWHKDRFLEFYLKQIDGYHLHENFEECFDEYAFQCTEKLHEDFARRGTSWFAIGSSEATVKSRCGKLFGKVFRKEHDKIFRISASDSRFSKILNFVGKWHFIAQFYEMFYQEENIRNSIPTDVRQCAYTFMTDFRRTVKCFQEGNMKISDCEIFVEYEKPIMKLYSVLLNKDNHSGSSNVDDELQFKLSIQKKHLKAISVTKRMLEDFVNLCTELEEVQVDVSVEDIQSMPLMTDGIIRDIIDPQKQLENYESGLDKVYNLDADYLEEIKIISAIHESETFKGTWKQVVHLEFENESDEVIIYTWKHILTQIWPKAKEAAINVITKISDGSMCIADLIEVFGFTDGKQDLIHEEMSKLCASAMLLGLNQFQRVMTERCHQIQNVLLLKKKRKSSILLSNLTDILKLESDFHALKVIEGNKELTLKDIDVNVSDILSDELWTNSEFMKILNEFVLQEKLVVWLKKKMKDRKEVKLFWDLAMISAGETSYEVDRASCFLSSVNAFAPLLFDLSKKAGMKELLNSCKVVWENAKSNEHLGDKWRDTGRQLEWFQGIHEAHGSVAAQSLTTAQEINSQGVYFITREEDAKMQIENCLRLSLVRQQTNALTERKSQNKMLQDLVQAGMDESVAREAVQCKENKTLQHWLKWARENHYDENKIMRVVQVYTKESVKVMDYNDLKDLQSKLMLIAGEPEKGQQDVSRFNDVLGAVASLAQRYINLIEGGCMLFNSLTVTVQCSGDKLVISLTFTKDSHPISTTSTLKDLESLVEILDKALLQWTDYIEKMRLKHYYLNDYNMQQIMYLCEKLAKSDFTDQMYSLLTNLNKQQVCQHVQQALDEATEIVEDEETSNDDSPFDDSNQNPDNSQTPLERKNKMIRELAKSGLTEVLAKAAVQQAENEDVEDCAMWALENEHNESLVMQSAAEFDEEAGFGPDSNHMMNYVSVLHNRTSVTLKELIADIQTSTDEQLSIHAAVDTICLSYNEKTSKLTLQDFLSIDHLGKFLGILREKLGSISGKIEREIFPGMQKGKANLILLPSQDMLYTTLALYAHNEEQPLPSRSEVIVCTEKTTKDEVGRFLRRSMLKNPQDEKKLFCMASAEKLMFTVSAHIETLFNLLSTKDCVDPEYQLIILCSSNEQQHYLVTCFDRSRIDLKIPAEKEKLSKYIDSKLKPDLPFTDTVNKASVKLVKSETSGQGKSLHVKRLTEKLAVRAHTTIIRLLLDTIDVDHVLNRLQRKASIMNEDSHLIHFDLTSAVRHGIEEFAFNLFVLGSLQDSQGRVWHHHAQHFYVMEMTESKLLSTSSVLNLFPCTECLSPKQALEIDEQQIQSDDVILMDEKEFMSETFQRPFQYLKRYNEKQDLDQFQYTEPNENEEECIRVLLMHCGMKNPSWAQLFYFASFLNVQLSNCEKSIFCQKIEYEESTKNRDVIEFPGLKNLAVHFMIKMAQDIATPSLDISDQSSRSAKKQDETDGLEQFQVRRKWENEAHPFVFFNEDHATMTFLNVNINSNGDLVDAEGKKTNMLSRQVVTELKRQGVPLGVDFNTQSRNDKLAVLCQFMNIPHVFDPDPTYELTTDNVLKMLAIYMRLRCYIPVIVMGETGCGKTRMIEFMSKMRSGHNRNAKNMVTLKVHGGLRVSDIYQCVNEARNIAAQNTRNHNLSTILFFDEANTTVAIHAIKEAVCDLTIDGEDFKDSNLQIVAACNPYKRLSEAAVKKLEESGLGYNVNATDTEHTGRIPMRRLVYRVVALPHSMQPFVWDFGQLGEVAEEIYICQMILHLKNRIGLTKDDADLIAFVLFRVQCYMRNICKDESRYVSLRDVERSLKTYEWFNMQSVHIFKEIKDYHSDQESKRPSHSNQVLLDMKGVHRCLLHTLSICYHASLDDRKSFRDEISKIFFQKSILITESEINAEIIACQAVFASHLKMDDNIACNEALRENAFLMTVCTDMRIPLFVVGKPGSSKSLARTIVADSMQGKSSHSDLYKHFKEVHILSYQCSALTDAKGIESIFNQCSQHQSRQDVNSYVAVVVLDEVGLAEDSPNMPLKVLHPLLEHGGTLNGSLTDVDQKNKIGFIGISNWALDPAKMNRGISITRNSPDKKDLHKTAKGIFENQKNSMNPYRKDIEALTDSYLEIYKGQGKEYFGLRDYYSLIKMLHANIKKKRKISPRSVYSAVQRNFSGGRETEKHLNIFHENLKKKRPTEYSNLPKRLTLKNMVLSNLKDGKSRFLLLLANQYSSFNLLQSFIPDFHKTVQVIFGSSFPNDHSYTEMCRNINRVKVCMEAGTTVILLNLTDINESLYDALNQHYVSLGGQKYVDLGLGGHRVKCRIADGFRLIVIELKEKVYEEYPIPLINRLEKHHLDSTSLLSEKEKEISDELTDWVNKFACIGGFQFKESDAILGHNEDTVSSVVLSCSEDLSSCKHILLQSATADAVFRASKGDLGAEGSELLKVYIEEQFHDNMSCLLKQKLREPGVTQVEITTFSNLLSDSDRTDLEESLGTGQRSIMLVSLQQFQTEQDYLKKLDDFIFICNKELDQTEKPAILLVQCPHAHKHVQLVACAKYGLKNKLSQLGNCKRKVVIALLLSTERRLKSGNSTMEEKGLSLQHSRDCEIIYVDEMRSSYRSCGQIKHFHKKTIPEVLSLGKNSTEEGFNIQLLLQDCICEALAMVKNNGNEDRNLERIQILSQLCSTDNEHFLDVLTKKMIEIYEDRESINIYGENWLIQEACSAEKLQAGGPFANTLWLSLKEHVSHLLAFIISIVDRNNNLDIFCKCDDMLHNLWLQIFDACRMKWEDMQGCKEFEIKQSHYTFEQSALRIPFCYVLAETMEEQWEAVEDLASDNESERCKIFLTNFRTSNKAMDKAVGVALRLPKAFDLIKAFGCELLQMMLHTSPAAAKTLSSALEVIARRYIPSTSSESDPQSLRFLLIFYALKIFQRQLKVVVDVLHLCSEAEEKLNEWTADLHNNSNEITPVLFHEKAIEYAVENGKEKALAIKDENSCILWMNFMTRLKTIFNSTTDLLEETSKGVLNKSWKPLSMLDMLFLHLLPNPSSSQDQFKRYLEVVSLHAKLVFKGTLKHALHGQQFLRIVCNALRKYYEDVRLRVILSWQKKTCRICNKDCKEPTILKCGHYFCTSCLKNNLLKSEEKTCFLCHEALGSDFEPSPATLNDIQKGEVDTFQANCTSFFLEYLSHFAFVVSANDSDAPEIIELIFDELILNDDTQKSELEKIGLNLNLATKSSIFSILMKYNSNKTKEVFNKHTDNQQFNGDLTSVARKQFDLTLQQRNASMDDDKLLRECSKLLQRFERLADNHDALLSCHTIEPVAGAYYAVRQFVKIITKPNILTAGNNEESDDEEQVNIDTFVYTIKRVISGKLRVLRELFIKIGCRTFGMDWFAQISKNDSFQKLIPESLQDSSNKTVDYFTSLGDSYSSMRADLNTTSVDKHREKVKEWFPDGQPICFNKLFAAVVWFGSHQQSKGVLDSHLSQIDDDGRYEILLAVVNNVWPLVKNSEKLSEQQISVLEQLILMTTGSVKSQSVMMRELHMLMADPRQVAELFWPAMPESFYFSIPEELRCEDGQNAMYRCPNGHFYTIGDCTRPWTESRCPDCHAEIGGRQHIAKEGNAKVEKLEEASQAGYMLFSSEQNMQQPQDRISQQATSVMQLMIHVCMFVGFTNNPHSAAQILPGMQEDVFEYLVNQIQKNLEDFAESVGRNLDETLLVLFGIMSGISDNQIAEETVMNTDWRSMESRKTWERLFRTNFLLPVFQNLDATIAKAQRNLNAAEDLTGLALFRLVHEVKEEEEPTLNPESQSKWWQDCHLWHFIEHPSTGHLLQCIRDHPRLQTGSVLHTLLETPGIDLLQYLEDALKLQKYAIDRYQNKLDLKDAENTTLRSFQAENMKYRPTIRRYVEMWNKARMPAQSSDPNNETAEWFMEDLTLDHPISAILPSSRGRGRCAKTIIRYVLEIQNRFLSKCFEITGRNDSEAEVDIPLLLPSDFVKVDKQKDILPLINLHTSHVVTEDAYGRHHVISYNVDALEKQARKHFVENKKLTKLESLPCIKYTQDVGIGSDWDNVIKRTKKQETLSGRLMQTLDESVAQATPADICEGVRTLTHAISFLAKVDCEHERLLHEYLQKDLLLDKNRTAMIPRSAKVHHTLALYQHLSWHKAVNFVQQGLKPYKGALDQNHQEEITDENVLQKIKDAFQHMDVILFQQRLNEMIVKVPDHKKDWSLKEDILPNDDFIGWDGSDDSWFDRIPEEVCFKHISHIFELAVQHVQNQK